MAIDLSLETAKKAAAAVGAVPPPEWAGKEDEWYVTWFTQGVNDGDPRLVKLAGGSAAEEAEGGIAPWEDAADPSEWLGKRKPTPRELRKYYNIDKRPEDFQRFDDRQLAAWIKDKWDIAGGHFLNDFGDVVDKPTESGPLSRAAGYATGEKSAGQAGGGGGGGKKEGAPPTDQYAESLQQGLLKLFSSQGGVFAEGGNAKTLPGERGLDLASGGVWWQPGTPTPPTPTPATVKLPTTAPVTPKGTTPAPITTPFMTNTTLAQGLAGLPSLTVPEPTPTMSPLQEALRRKKFPFAGAFKTPANWWEM